MQWKIGVVSLIFLLQIDQSRAANDLAFSSNARTFETQQSSLVVKGLANSCLTITMIPDGLQCNPAHTAMNRKSTLGAELLLSNGYANLKRINDLLDGEVNQEMVDSLFAEGQITKIEAGANIIFQSKILSGQYVPFSLRGFSVVRNEANPDVEVYAVEEKGFAFQGGLELFNNFYAGLQTRLMNRKFIRKRFKLVQLATQQGKDLLKPKTQFATYIEPGLTYILSDQWKPRVSIFVANLGMYSEEFDELKTPVETQFGFGLTPPMTWGELELSLEYRSMNYEEDTLQKLRFGALYHYGSMFLMGGLDSNGISGGVYYSLDKLNAGIVYSTTRFINEVDEYFTQTVYVQLGWQI